MVKEIEIRTMYIERKQTMMEVKEKMGDCFSSKKNTSHNMELTRYFKELFPGREYMVVQENTSENIMVDLNVLMPSEEERYYLIYTTGMSNYAMKLPKELQNREELKYAELFMFLPDTWKLEQITSMTRRGKSSELWPLSLLRYLAKLPYEYQTFFGWGDTISNGPRYSPFSKKAKMGGVVLFQSEDELGSLRTGDGTVINLFMVVPVYREEIEYKVKYGIEALNERFTQNRFQAIFDSDRPNYCSSEQERCVV